MTCCTHVILDKQLWPGNKHRGDLAWDAEDIEEMSEPCKLHQVLIRFGRETKANDDL
jgi:hypothetical protein